MTLAKPAIIDTWLDMQPTMKDGVLTVRQFTISNLTELLRSIKNDPSLARWNHLYIYADRIIVNSDSHENIVMTSDRQFVTIIARQVTIEEGELTFVTQEPSNLLKIHLYIQEYTGSSPNFVIVGTNNDRSIKVAPANLWKSALPTTKSLHLTTIEQMMLSSLKIAKRFPQSGK
ncbi:hypothetical protein [Microseira wollei]|uniref:Uncharacterized protein n=1 Tax=Microseira wollei NIES-4236 TaxID=2530354 RepID=A0AAV3XIW6_9CYAN|nr:hypothetical protein [Microseira wollei]GET41446.1 hypothetical protein MiSe_62580 [Microseira wollei NIES-4236]